MSCSSDGAAGSPFLRHRGRFRWRGRCLRVQGQQRAEAGYQNQPEFCHQVFRVEMSTQTERKLKSVVCTLTHLVRELLRSATRTLTVVENLLAPWPEWVTGFVVAEPLWPGREAVARRA